MFQVLHNFFYNLSAFDFEIAFIILASVCLVVLLVDILLSIFLSNFTLFKRSFYLVTIVAVYAFSKAMFMAKGYVITAEILFSASLLLGLPLLFIRVKSENECSLNKLIDRAIETEQIDDREYNVERLECTEKIEEKANEDSKNDIDFTHVKGILERLNYYPLSSSDKNKMRELEAILLKAERGEREENYKLKINEGLGELLKIMSRYGV